MGNNLLTKLNAFLISLRERMKLATKLPRMPSMAMIVWVIPSTLRRIGKKSWLHRYVLDFNDFEKIDLLMVAQNYSDFFWLKIILSIIVKKIL